MIDLIIAYVLLYASVLFHEAMHISVALLYSIKLVRVQLGVDWLQIHIGKFHISPIIGVSFVETDYEDINKLSNKRQTCYFLSGCLGNLLLAAAFGFLWMIYQKQVFFITSISNFVLALSSIIPFGSTDLKVLLDFLKNKH